jgi:UDP-glucose 4-epimerase
VRILVTGAFGYVGRAVTLRLLDAGHEVVALTRPRSDHQLVAGFDNVHVIEADLRDRDHLHIAVEGMDGVCHLAALTRVRESFERPDEYHAVNVGGTTALLEALAETRGSGAAAIPFVLASTAAVYGAPETQPITEDAAPAPTSPYGESKLAAEQAVRTHAAAGAVAAIVLRAFNVAGGVAGFGDPDESRIIPRTLLAAAGLRPALTVNGDGTAVRDFVHVDDVARAYLSALTTLDRPSAGEPRIYNVGATGASVREIIAAVESVTGRQVPVVRGPAQPEVPVLLADTGRIRGELGWKPERSSLEELVADTWQATVKP